MVKTIQHYNRYNSCSIIEDENSGLELQIVGKEGKFFTVAQIPRPVDSAEKRIRKRLIDALKWHFSGKQYSVYYVQRAKRGETDPYKTWARIKKRFNLSDKYDIALSESKEDQMYRQELLQLIS